MCVDPKGNIMTHHICSRLSSKNTNSLQNLKVSRYYVTVINDSQR